MKKPNYFFVLAIFFSLLFILPSFALQVQSAGPKAYGYGMWHEDYFLFAARIEDSLISGTSTEPQVFPANDDGIELCFNLPTADGRRVTSRLIVSVAGGFMVLTQDGTGRWKTDDSWLQPPAIIKLATEIYGTLNKPTDTDRHFTIELAIPWERLGGTPKTLNAMLNSFNFLVRVRGENQTFVSWSPLVMNEEDNGNSARWGAMLLYPGNRPARVEPGAFICPRSYRVPLIDGKLAADEWIGASIITLQKPEPEFQPSPEPERSRAEFPQVMALYRYDYLAGKPVAANAKVGLIQQPRESAGPWMSGDRPGWHREQFQDMQRAGVEILLPIYPVDPTARAQWARSGLTALTTALREQRSAGKFYPLIGMYLDFSGLATATGEELDLTLPLHQQMVYSAIREFYRQVAPEFRFDIGAGEQQGCLVALGAPTGIVRWDPSFIAYAEKEFARDFHQSKLYWMADPQWKEHDLTGLYAYAPLTGSQPTVYDTTGKTSVAVISPGYADFAAGILRPYGEGPELREEWRKMLTLGPDYVVLVSWNDFVRGSSVAPTRQHGFTLIDTLSLLVSQEAEKVKQPIRLKKVNMPASIAPASKTQIELLLSNTSPEIIQSDQRIGLDMRILDKSGKFTFATKNDVVPFRITPGGSIRLDIPITAVDTNGKSLSPGNYLIEFNLHRSQIAYLKSPLLVKKLASFRLPLQVARPANYAFTVLASNLHPQLKNGAKYTVSLALRNDGARKWRKKDTRITYKWYRLSNTTDSLSEHSLQELGIKSVTSSLLKDANPGEVVTVPVTLETPAAGEAEQYGLAWVLNVDGKDVATVKDTKIETVYFFKEDIGGRFVDSTTPREMSAGQQYPVKLVLQNVGADTWPAQKTAVTCRWYYWDGTPSAWEGSPTLLPTAVKAGDSTQVPATIQAPQTAGAYYLVWELQLDEQSSLFSSNTNGDGLLCVPVMVQGGTCNAIDIGRYGNVVVAVSERRRSSGDFDGLGSSFPLECFPPDLSSNTVNLYPSGYYTHQGENNSAKQRAIAFRFPDKESGLSKAIACQGQTIPVESVTTSQIHILGAGTGAGLSGSIVIAFADGHTQVTPLTMSSWLESPLHGESVALAVPYIRATREDNLHQPAYLHHYVISLSEPGALTALQLPNNPEMKVLAITLEGPGELQ